MTCWPTQAVTPVESRESLTTKRQAMNTTVGSPKPASACPRSRIPVSQSMTDTPIATIASGIRLEMNATIARAKIASVTATGLIFGPYT